MSAPRFVLDDRTAADIVVELRALATDEDVPGLSRPGPGTGPDVPVPWSDVLFPTGELRRAEPSGALLHAVGELYPGLLRHFATLPDRALVDWLERRLGIDRLPVVPDTVVAVPTPDPKRLPVVVPAGTMLRGGRDVAGNERRYATTETVTVLGTEVRDVRSYRIAPDPAGESKNEWIKRDLPFDPYPANATVVHSTDIVTDVIAFEGGSLNVRLRFVGALQEVPTALIWRYSTAGGLKDAVVTAQSENVVDLQLSGSCAPLATEPGGSPFVQVSLPEPPFPNGAFDLSFDYVTAEVVVREGVKPDAAFYNDGVVDITKEFQPFGPVPKRGDSFYVQSEEAFGKPLNSVKVTLRILGNKQMKEVAWGSGIPTYVKVAIQSYEEESGKTFGFYLKDEIKDAGDARVLWQRYDGTAWDEFERTEDALKSVARTGLVPLSPSGDHDPKVYSRPVEVGGVTGRMVRAFLDQGDFGWVDYQRRVARFAAQAAKAASPQASDLIPPDPPIISTITLGYTTGPVRATIVRSTNGWSIRNHGAADRLFALPLPPDADSGAAGEIGFGLGLSDDALGAVVSLFVEIDPAAACAADDVPAIAWECWTAFGWNRIDVVDGTTGLRQAGLLRFVAPSDWGSGCPEFSADLGRWLRIVTNQPHRLGAIRAIVADAVTAEYRSLLPDPSRDPTPASALGPRELKGPMVPIAGIKKLTNPLAGSVGRGPEPDQPYVARGAQRTRHRNRAVQAWDYEAIVSAEFPEVATVRCLPHTGSDGDDEPGVVGLVVVPWSDEPQPVPSVALAERILAALEGRTPVHARPVVLCPLYQGVSVSSKIVLRPGYGAAVAKQTLATAIDTYLRPGADAPFGRELFASTLVRFLESRPEVDHVTTFVLYEDPCPRNATGDACIAERVTVDPCRGLVASAARHELMLTERL